MHVRGKLQLIGCGSRCSSKNKPKLLLILHMLWFLSAAQYFFVSQKYSLLVIINKQKNPKTFFFGASLDTKTRGEVKAGVAARNQANPPATPMTSLSVKCSECSSSPSSQFEQPGSHDSARAKPPRKVSKQKNTPEATFRLRDQTASLAAIQACGPVRCSRLLIGCGALPRCS